MNRIARDVKTAWLTMNAAQQPMTVTAALLKQVNARFDYEAELAALRFRCGTQP